MNELTLDGKTYVSSKRAAEITGYAKDYVGQLCREGHVEARLVGRNWYVLETSIRDHRFGVKEKAPEEKKEHTVATSTWEPLRYKPEVPTYIAPIQSKPEEGGWRVAREIPDLPQPGKGMVVGDMQSAWQEWFTKKQTPTQETEISKQEVEAVKVQEEAPKQIQVTVVEEPEIREEASDIEEPAYDSVNALDLTEPEIQEEVYEEPTEEIRAPRRSFLPRNLVLQSIFIGISLIAIAIAVIGTGFATRFGSISHYRLSEINFLTGEAVYNK